MAEDAPILAAVYYHEHRIESDCQVENLDCKRAYLVSKAPMPVDTRLAIRLASGGGEMGPFLACRVAHVDEPSSREKTGKSGMALHFEELGEDVADFLKALADGTPLADAAAPFEPEPAPPEAEDLNVPEPVAPEVSKEPEPEQAEAAPETGAEAETPAEDVSEPTAETEMETEQAVEMDAEAEGAAEADAEPPTGEAVAEPAATEATETEPEGETSGTEPEGAPTEQLGATGEIVSGEIGSSHGHGAPRAEEPSVIVQVEPAEAPTEQATEEAPEADAQPEESKEEAKEETPPEESKPKKRRRRGRRKKKK